MTEQHVEQLELFSQMSERELRTVLEKGLGRRIDIVLTNNASSMLSVRKRGDVSYLRLHRMFLDSSQVVLDEIVCFLKGKRAATPMANFHAFVRKNHSRIENRLPRKVSLRTKGSYYDLQELFAEINAGYFDKSIDAAITWGANGSRRAARNRTLGSYSEQSNLIRISQVLDRKNVPRYYIAFIVYHEMLHAAMGISKRGDRRSMHSGQFRKREKLFRDYERAIAWETGDCGSRKAEG